MQTVQGLLAKFSIVLLDFFRFFCRLLRCVVKFSTEGCRKFRSDLRRTGVNT